MLNEFVDVIPGSSGVLSRIGLGLIFGLLGFEAIGLVEVDLVKGPTRSSSLLTFQRSISSLYFFILPLLLQNSARVLLLYSSLIIILLFLLHRRDSRRVRDHERLTAPAGRLRRLEFMAEKELQRRKGNSGENCKHGSAWAVQRQGSTGTPPRSRRRQGTVREKLGSGDSGVGDEIAR
jgi:hypothetical protein